MNDTSCEGLRAIAKDLQCDPEIMLALVKTWGPHNDPVLVIVPTNHDRQTTRRLRAKVSRVAPAGWTFQSHRPQPILGRVRGRRRVIGFHAPYWKFVFDESR